MIQHRERRAITREEHEAIVTRARNPEFQGFLRCCWHLGGSQSDIAQLKAEDIDWPRQMASFFRSKTGVAQIIHFGDQLAATLRQLPTQGPLFPRLAAMNEKHRATRFQMICRRLKIQGVYLHSYRYAWWSQAGSGGASRFWDSKCVTPFREILSPTRSSFWGGEGATPPFATPSSVCASPAPSAAKIVPKPRNVVSTGRKTADPESNRQRTL